MAKLKDIQHSQNGEAVLENHFDNTLLYQDVSGVIEGEHKAPEQSHILFKLVRKKKGRTYVDGICNNVMNPKTKRRERVWLLNGADSIWQSELVEPLKDKEYIKKSRYSLCFENGVCRIPVINEKELEYARVNSSNVGKNRNGSGKFDYYEYDPLEEQKARYEKELNKIKTIQLISNMKDDDVKKLAFFLGIKPNDDELGMPKGPEGIKTELLLKANSQPEIVNKYVGAPEVEISYLIRKGIVEAKIDLANGTVMWAGGKGYIAKIPQSRKPLEYLTELAMTNSNEGRQFKEQLEAIIT